MRFTWRWPLRRTPSPVARQADQALAAPSATVPVQAEPFQPDAELIAGLSGRAADRDALPILGPQGGLPATARFLTVAREMADALPVAAWSQEIIDAARPPATVGSHDFIATLPSLASFRDPSAIVSGEAEGSPFPEWGSVGPSTAVFAGAGEAAERVDAGRPRPGAAASRSSIVARLAERRAAEGQATVRRTATPATQRPPERAATAPLPGEPPSQQPVPVRRGLITEQPAPAPAGPGAVESPPTALATSEAPESPPAQPQIQRATEFPPLDVATPAGPSDEGSPLAPELPHPAEDVLPDLESPAEPADEPPPLQVARLAEEIPAPAIPPADELLPAPERSPAPPPVAGQPPLEPVEMPLLTTETRPGPLVEPVEMPLLTTETRPGPLVEPVAGDVTGTDRPAAVARLSSALTPAEMGVRSGDPDLSPGAQPSPESDDVAPGPVASGQGQPLLPLAPVPETVPGAVVEPPPGAQRRAAASPGDQAPGPTARAVPVQQLAAADIVEPPAQPGPGSTGPTLRASPAIGGMSESAGGVIDLDQPLLLTEPWGVGLPEDVPRETDETGGFDSSSPGGGATATGDVFAPRQPLRARPAAVVSRSAETPTEPRLATPLPLPQPGGREASPGGAPTGPAERRTRLAPSFERPAAADASAPPVLRTVQPVGRLTGSDQDDLPPWSLDRPTAPLLRDGPPVAWPAEAEPERQGELSLPALDLIAPPVAASAPGAAPAIARPAATAGQGAPAVSLSRLADLPLAPVPALMREGEAARPESAAAEPAAGAVGAAAPAIPPAGAAAEGEIDKVAERVWQVIRRRLQIERERQRGLP